ncbi:MAG: DUF2202 domain-containing protein [Thiotrichaceae bacterium]
MLQTWQGELKFENVALNASESASMRYMREEEKLAHDIYSAFHELWGNSAYPIFANIAESEQRHCDAMQWLLDNYHITVSIIPQSGQFTEPKLQNLYHELLAQGQSSIIAALQVGARLEEIDINDLNVTLRSSTNPNIQHVYRELLQGSHDHLRAFVYQLKLNHVNYTPQTLELVEFERILQSITPAVLATDAKKVVFMTQR